MEAKPFYSLPPKGGVDIELVSASDQAAVACHPVSISHGASEEDAAAVLTQAGLEPSDELRRIVLTLYDLFLERDAFLVEINPLLQTADGTWCAVDAKIVVDDEALYRQSDHLPRLFGQSRSLTYLQSLAFQNDQLDTRGTAGRMFHEITGGDIVVLASGGGTSSEALDSLHLLEGHPAVFTEYSGNPTGEKVKGLTKIALMTPQPIHAVWVIGGRANFTDIYETLVNGVMAGIRETQEFDKRIPVVIRRAGPRDSEAFEALRRARELEGYNIYLRGMATSVLESTRMVIYHARKHAKKQRRSE